MAVWDCALGFMDAQILLAAEELGVFDRLEEAPGTPAELAAAVGLPADSAERLMTGLCALGFVQRSSDGRYRNGAEASETLVRGKPGYVGAMFRHLRNDLYPVWTHFKEALVENRAQWHRGFGGGPAPTERMYAEPDKLRAFMEGMHAISHRAGVELAAQARQLAAVRTIVDVGGASGAFLIALAEAFPDLRGAVFDLPPVGPIANDFFRRHGLTDRLRFHAGDFWEDPLPGGADAYSLGFVLHDWDETGGSILLRKIADAIRPGGLLVIGEYLLDDDRTGPLHVARMDLNMLAATRGRERTAAEYADWIGRFGFRPEATLRASCGKSFLIARH